MKTCRLCRQKKLVKKVYLCDLCMPVLTPQNIYQELALLKLKTTFGKSLNKKDGELLFSIAEAHPETINQVYEIILGRLGRIERSFA